MHTFAPASDWSASLCSLSHLIGFKTVPAEEVVLIAQFSRGSSSRTLQGLCCVQFLENNGFRLPYEEWITSLWIDPIPLSLTWLLLRTRYTSWMQSSGMLLFWQVPKVVLVRSGLVLSSWRLVLWSWSVLGVFQGLAPVYFKVWSCFMPCKLYFISFGTRASSILGHGKRTI